MYSNLQKHILDLVEQGVKVRSAFYESIDLDDEQELGPPADTNLIEKLEKKIEHTLPPSYRVFLELHDGWRMVDAETDLMSLNEMLGGPRAKKVKAWQDQAEKWGAKVTSKGLVIGHSNISQSRIILDQNSVDSEGEWRLIESYKDEEVEYVSFLLWLENSLDDYLQILGKK